MAVPEGFDTGSHISLHHLKAHWLVVARIDPYIHGKLPGLFLIIRRVSPVDMAVQLPTLTARLVPAPHRVVIQPDVLAANADHLLLDTLVKQRPY